MKRLGRDRRNREMEIDRGEERDRDGLSVACSVCSAAWQQQCMVWHGVSHCLPACLPLLQRAKKAKGKGKETTMSQMSVSRHALSPQK